MEKLSSVLKVGLIAGFLFFAHALIPNSNAWPLVWPALAGFFVVYSLKNTGKLKNYVQTIISLLKMSALSAAIFFLLTLLVLFVLNLPETEKISNILGAEGPIIINSAVIISLLIASGLGVILAMISGSVSYPFLRKK